MKRMPSKDLTFQGGRNKNVLIFVVARKISMRHLLLGKNELIFKKKRVFNFLHENGVQHALRAARVITNKSL